MTDPAATAPPAPATEMNPELQARIKRLMLIAGLTTALGIAAVFVAIGYRLFKGEGSVSPSADVTAALPKGARIVSTGTAGDRIVVTIEVTGAMQIRTFDARTLKPAGQLRFVTEP